MADRKVRIGVVGLGNMGTGHIEWLSQLENAELAACCDIVPEKAKSFGEKYKIPYFTDADKMIKSGKVEAITIAVPHYFHTPIAISALDHGVHVLTEKPVGVHKNDILKMIEAHKRNPKLVFAAMFQMRLTPAYRKLHDLIQSGEFGRIQRINWIVTTWFRSQAYYDSGSWRATWKGEGGGVLLNQCPHHIDLFQWMFGMPSKVHATCAIGKYHNIEVEDDVSAYFEYPDGRTATFITSTGEAPGTNRLEFSCERGRVVLENNKIEFLRNEMTTSQFRETTKSIFGTPPYWSIQVPIPSDSYNGMYHKTLLHNFCDSILNGTELVAHAEEGLNSVELANAMLYSSMNHTDVDLPLDGDAFEKMLKGLIRKSTFKKTKSASKSKVDDMSKSYNK